jgi:hypothetical protein
MKSLNTPNFSWGFFNFGLRRSARPLPRCYSFPLASRAKRDIKTKRDLLLRRRLTLKIPQLKLEVLREFRTVSHEVDMRENLTRRRIYKLTYP